MNEPLHVDICPPAWRFTGGFVNLLVLGAVIIGARFFSSAPEVLRWVALGFSVFYWAVCALTGRSIGSVVCMLELRCADMSSPDHRVRWLHALPYAMIGVVAYAPRGFLVGASDSVRLLGMLLSTLFLVAEAAALMLARRSMMDRALGLIVVRLDLPSHLRPRIFGIRVT